MSLKEQIDLKIHLLRCPFEHSCVLPKSDVICTLPNYKMCSEYELKLKSYKTRSRITY